jgi:hypothetical protein
METYQIKSTSQQPILIPVSLLQVHPSELTRTNVLLAYLKSDLFTSDDIDDSSYAGIRHVKTFKTVARFLVDLAEKEIKFGGKDAFTVWKNRAAAFKAQFLGEFKAYARHQYPFNIPVDEKKGVLKWWKALIGLESAVILPVRCIFQLFDYQHSHH